MFGRPKLPNQKSPDPRVCEEEQLEMQEETGKSFLEDFASDVSRPGKPASGSNCSPQDQMKPDQHPQQDCHQAAAATKKTGMMIFCECSSIRGMPKIARSSSKFLRKMWLAFVIVMTLVLIVSSSLSIRSYLNYDVIVHTSDIPKFASPFPAITICLHQPFSSRAFKLWANKTVMSPREYNALLRGWALETINRTSEFYRMQESEMNPISYSLYYDMLEIYYQNIPFHDITVLSHDPSVIRKCIVKTTSASHFKDPCNLTEHGFSIKLFSHPKHLNCYTVEPSGEAASLDTQFLGLAVDLGPPPDYANFQQGFLNDVFDQATGLRVVIHEPNRYPNVEHFGKNVEAGKMTELAYTPTLWNRSNTPVNPCITSGEPYADLGRVFEYTQRECANKHLQELVMSRCNCIVSLPGMPRSQPPTKDMSYCASFTSVFNKTFDDFVRQLQCYVDISQAAPQWPCLPRCILTEYETKLSVTYWGATDWQVYWSGKFVNDIEELGNLIRERDSAEQLGYDGELAMRARFEAVKQRLLRYLTKTNLTAIAEDQGPDDMVESKNFAYVVLKRNSENLILKEEKKVLTLNALMSQIGGLCSLTIGLTCACVVEVVEFLYIYLTSRTGSAGKTRREKEHAAPVAASVTLRDQEGVADGGTPLNSHHRRARPSEL